MLSEMLSRRELLALTPKVPMMLNFMGDTQTVRLERLEGQVENLLCEIDGLTDAMINLIEVIKIMEETLGQIIVTQSKIISASDSNFELLQAEINRLKEMTRPPYVKGTRERQSQS